MVPVDGVRIEGHAALLVGSGAQVAPLPLASRQAWPALFGDRDAHDVMQARKDGWAVQKKKALHKEQAVPGWLAGLLRDGRFDGGLKGRPIHTARAVCVMAL